MNTYSWKINKVECTPTVGDLTNYVNTIHWSYCADYEDKSAYINGATSFAENPNIEDYTPFNKIQEKIIIGWLEYSIDMEQLKIAVDNELESKYKATNIFNNPFEEQYETLT
jgi:hypothetical protein